ncbi:uncharacterized protein [Scyliorhinus torazame]|uniref:Uncharacterized protein n=1 Tax=Scyliorhinus torazame TaxID=75743 RepID=A0A401NYW9_SCYTO|nr:hypothetical protein [Scyliorhinus torazame]
MATSTVPKGLIVAFVLAFCESQDNTSSQLATFGETSTLSTVQTLFTKNISESSHVNLRNASFGLPEKATFANKTKKAITQTPLHTYLLSQSQVPKTLRLSKETNTVLGDVNKEPSNPSEIFVSEDELLASQRVTTGPTLSNVLENTNGTTLALTSAIYGTSQGNTCINPSEVSIFGLKTWKFSLISAVIPVFLAIEALALAIYCTKCKTRGRKAMPAKSCEDSEAAETINAESNENTLTVNNTTVSQAKFPLETSETQCFSEVEKEAMDEQPQDPSNRDTGDEDIFTA